MVPPFCVIPLKFPDYIGENQENQGKPRKNKTNFFHYFSHLKAEAKTSKGEMLDKLLPLGIGLLFVALTMQMVAIMFPLGMPRNLYQMSVCGNVTVRFVGAECIYFTKSDSECELHSILMYGLATREFNCGKYIIATDRQNNSTYLQLCSEAFKARRCFSFQENIILTMTEPIPYSFDDSKRSTMQAESFCIAVFALLICIMAFILNMREKKKQRVFMLT